MNETDIVRPSLTYDELRAALKSEPEMFPCPWCDDPCTWMSKDVSVRHGHGYIEEVKAGFHCNHCGTHIDAQTFAHDLRATIAKQKRDAEMYEAFLTARGL